MPATIQAWCPVCEAIKPHEVVIPGDAYRCECEWYHLGYQGEEQSARRVEAEQADSERS